jgi:L-ascorbate metabolism protein UlaG (beta-lactamase superfamily)
MKMTSAVRCLVGATVALALAESASAFVAARLFVNGPATNATAKIEVPGGPIIYVDPVLLPATTPADADFILITHNHPDHQELASINRIRKANTVIYSSPPGVPALMSNLAGVTINAVIPGEKFVIRGIEVETVPMYNIVKNNHPRAMNFVGYVINVAGVRIYAAGDTERIPEMKTFTADVALLPLGQTFTMNSVQEAVDAALDVRARIAIPYHYGRGEGTLADALNFTSLLSGRMQTMLNTGTNGFSIDVSSSVIIAEHPASQTIAPGTNTTFSVQAGGAGNLTYQWRHNGTLIPGATSTTLSVTAATAARAGDYDVIIVDGNGTVVTRAARLIVDTPRPGRLTNMSVRATARGPSAPLIVGAFVAGGSKPVLIRGIGPALANFGVTGPVLDPRLDIYANVNGRDTIVASNNDWGAGGAAASLRTTFGLVGAFDLPDAASRDAAVVTTIDSSRTVHVSDVTERSGVALVEIYDTDPSGPARLVNLSARNFAGAGDNTLIAGFAISGNVPRRLLIRGVGPRLADFGVTGALADPKVELYSTEGGRNTLFAANDNWADVGIIPALTASTSVGAFELPDTTSRDAALVVTVPAGPYTAQVTGVGNATGEALIEIYELP